MTTLKLWVSNQPGDCDSTYHYICAAHWTPPAGVTLTPAAEELAGDDPEAVFAAFRSLAERVADVGHGDDIDDADAVDRLGEPNLTACPAGDEDYPCARLSLLRLTSREAPTYAAWMAR